MQARLLPAAATAARAIRGAASASQQRRARLRRKPAARRATERAVLASGRRQRRQPAALRSRRAEAAWRGRGPGRVPGGGAARLLCGRPCSGPGAARAASHGPAAACVRGAVHACSRRHGGARAASPAGRASTRTRRKRRPQAHGPRASWHAPCRLTGGCGRGGAQHERRVQAGCRAAPASGASGGPQPQRQQWQGLRGRTTVTADAMLLRERRQRMGDGRAWPPPAALRVAGGAPPVCARCRAFLVGGTPCAGNCCVESCRVLTSHG